MQLTMNTKNPNPFSWFLISSLTNALVIIVACFLWTDFKIQQVANIMFWVGALTVIIGLITAGLVVPVANKYSGQTVAIWTTLKHAVPAQEISTKIGRDKKIQKFKIAASISIPGIILLIISWQML